MPWVREIISRGSLRGSVTDIEDVVARDGTVQSVRVPGAGVQPGWRVRPFTLSD